MKLQLRAASGLVSTDLQPTKILCLGRNYREHAEEMGGTIPAEPLLFLKPPSCLIEDGGTVLLPNESKVVHHEVELAVIIEKPARRISTEAWREYVYGFSIFLDITARDLQDTAKRHGDPWTISKGFDTFGPISPVTPRSTMTDPHQLRISLKKNGEIKQDSNTANMIFKIPKILEYASRVMTLERGDVIATGTPEGVGEITDGDKIEAAIDGLGSLTVRVKRT